MIRAAPLIALSLLAAACSREPAAPSVEDAGRQPPAANSAPPATGPLGDAPATFPVGEWETASSGEGDGLFFGAVEGEPGKVHMFCESGGGLLVNVNAFRPVGSEERMTIGSSGTAVALVADPAGDPNRGGVSGEGPVPAELGAILGGQAGLTVVYGAQQVGPLPPVPNDVARQFLTGCED